MFLEALEARIAPAGVTSVPHFDSSSTTFQDVDGDQVTVKFSKNVLSSDSLQPGIFSFTPGPNGGKTLDSLDLTHLGLSSAKLRGLGVSITAEKSGGGDGLVNVGSILADGIDLGKVEVDGALGKIIAGDAKPATPGLVSLKVDSLGLTDGPTAASVIVGAVKSLEVTHDVSKAMVSVSGANAGIGTVKIGGSLIGGDAESSGSIAADGRIGKAFVGGDIVGGNGLHSGSILSKGGMGTVEVKGSVTGGDGAGGFSGLISSTGTIAHVTVGGNLVGGTGERSGMISADKGISSVEVSHDIIGGDGYAAGRIETAKKITAVHVGGNVVGGTADYAGSIMSMKTIKEVHIGGDLQGAAKKGSGSVFSEEGITRLTVSGDLLGGAGEGSGCVEAAKIIGIACVDGDLKGAVGNKSGSVLSFGGKFHRIDHDGHATTGAGANSGVFFQPTPTANSGGATGGCVIYAVGPNAEPNHNVVLPTTGATLTLAGSNVYGGITTAGSGTLVLSGGNATTGTIQVGLLVFLIPTTINGVEVPAGTYTSGELQLLLKPA